MPGSSLSRHLESGGDPGNEVASTYDISAERNIWLQSALRSFAIVCDYMETGLFAIYDPRSSAIRDRLRSFAIIWKPALSSDEKGLKNSGLNGDSNPDLCDAVNESSC